MEEIKVIFSTKGAGISVIEEDVKGYAAKECDIIARTPSVSEGVMISDNDLGTGLFYKITSPVIHVLFTKHVLGDQTKV